MGGPHKLKRGGHSVNAKQHVQNTHRLSRIGFIGPQMPTETETTIFSEVGQKRAFSYKAFFLELECLGDQYL